MDEGGRLAAESGGEAASSRFAGVTTISRLSTVDLRITKIFEKKKIDCTLISAAMIEKEKG